MCDTNTINVTFYLLKVLHEQKKKYEYCRIIQKIEGGHFIESIYIYIYIYIFVCAHPDPNVDPPIN